MVSIVEGCTRGCCVWMLNGSSKDDISLLKFVGGYQLWERVYAFVRERVVDECRLL